MTLDQWSNLFVHASMAMYAVAFVAFAVSFGASRSPQPKQGAEHRALAGADAAGTARAEMARPETAQAQATQAGAVGTLTASPPMSPGSPRPGTHLPGAPMTGTPLTGAPQTGDDVALAGTTLTPAELAARARSEARARSPQIEAEMAREGADRRGRRRRGGAGGDAAAELPPGRRAANIGMSLTWLAFCLLLVGVVLRGFWAGRAPWGNMYEFSLSTALAVTGVFLAVSLRRDVRWLGVLVTAASLLTLGVAVLLLYTDSAALVPALHSYWLIIHVAAAIVASGAFTVGAAATVCYLMADRAEREAAPGYEPRTFGGPLGGMRAGIHRTNSRLSASVARRVPDSASLDTLAYKVNAFVFPLWTFAVIAGAIWAEDAWGRYWGWDPKETWAFITWLVYAAYLHARATAGWRGRKAAGIALLGFACFLINYFGVNLFANGLHSYSGL